MIYYYSYQTYFIIHFDSSQLNITIILFSVTGTVCNVINQVIMERLTQFCAHQDGMSVSPTLTIAQETSQMAIDDNLTDCRSTECISLLGEGRANPSPPNCVKESTTVYQSKLLKYLVNSYNCSLNEEKNYPKVRMGVKSFLHLVLNGKELFQHIRFVLQIETLS